MSTFFVLYRVKLNQDLVIALPDIFQIDLGSDAEFILLASDGLWDYMNKFVIQPFSLGFIYIPEVLVK